MNLPHASSCRTCHIATISAFISATTIGFLLLSGDNAGAQGGFDAAVVDVSGFNQPTSMAFAPDGRLFVAEKSGRLRIVSQDGTLIPTPFTELSVTRDGERGLLGIAFDPGFATNGYLYLSYTTSQGHNRVSRFAANAAAPDRAVAGSEVVILDNIPGASTHDAGSMHFGPDGYLYVAVGDARTPTLAQALDSLSGKILRLNPRAYPNVVPTNNPFATDPSARREIWAYGLRNPFTFAFDRGGRMFINDVGQGTWEEINRGEAGANYGWPTCEGPLNTGNGICSSGSFTYPLVAYGRSAGGAVTGAVVYEGTQFPAEYRGSYFFGDYVGGWIRRITTANQSRHVPHGCADPHRPGRRARRESVLSVIHRWRSLSSAVRGR